MLFYDVTDGNQNSKQKIIIVSVFYISSIPGIMNTKTKYPKPYAIIMC